MSLVERFTARYGRVPTEFDPDYLEMLRMSKYRIKEVPDVQPGKCANCGSSKNDGRKYIDFGLQVDWYGAVFLCGLCLEDIAKAMGLFNKYLDSIELLSVRLKRSVEEQANGEELLFKMLQANKEFENFVNLHSLGDDNASDRSTNVVPPETASEPRINKAEPRVTKSTSGSGSQNFRSLADLIKDGGG